MANLSPFNLSSISATFPDPHTGHRKKKTKKKPLPVYTKYAIELFVKPDENEKKNITFHKKMHKFKAYYCMY